jgi:hypothetical protein
MDYKSLMNGQRRGEFYHIGIPLAPVELRQLRAVCGPRRAVKRGQWIREAILEKLAREREARRSA